MSMPSNSTPSNDFIMGPIADTPALTLNMDPEFQELIAMFAGELGDRAETLRVALASDDGDRLKRTAHQLKGAAPGYGYAEIGSLAAVVERLCANEATADALAPAVDRLVAACEAASRA